MTSKEFLDSNYNNLTDETTVRKVTDSENKVYTFKEIKESSGEGTVYPNHLFGYFENNIEYPDSFEKYVPNRFIYNDNTYKNYELPDELLDSKILDKSKGCYSWIELYEQD